MERSVERLQLCSCAPGQCADFVFLIDVISGFSRCFVGSSFCFLSRAITPLLQHDKQEGAETGKATAVAAG